MAAYRKAVEDRLGPIWYRLVKIHEDELSAGTVDTTFEIPAVGGKVRKVKLVRNTGNAADAVVVLRAIDGLRAPPIPPQVLAELHQDYLHAEESFAVLANP